MLTTHPPDRARPGTPPTGRLALHTERFLRGLRHADVLPVADARRLTGCPSTDLGRLARELLHPSLCPAIAVRGVVGEDSVAFAARADGRRIAVRARLPARGPHRGAPLADRLRRCLVADLVADGRPRPGAEVLAAIRSALARARAER